MYRNNGTYGTIGMSITKSKLPIVPVVEEFNISQTGSGYEI